MEKPVAQSGGIPPELEKCKKAIDTLAGNKAVVREAAAKLTRRIELFEAWVGTLAGRVESSIQLPDPDGETDCDLWLWVRQFGKVWQLDFGYCWQGDPESLKFEPVKGASIKVKLAAVESIPALIQQMAQEQSDLAARINAVTEKFDVFAQHLGLSDGKEIRDGQRL